MGLQNAIFSTDTIYNGYILYNMYIHTIRVRKYEITNLPIILYTGVQDKGKRVTKTFDIHYTYNIL